MLSSITITITKIKIFHLNTDFVFITTFNSSPIHLKYTREKHI